MPSRFNQALFAALELAVVAAFLWLVVIAAAAVSPGAFPQ